MTTYTMEWRLPGGKPMKWTFRSLREMKHRRKLLLSAGAKYILTYLA